MAVTDSEWLRFLEENDSGLITNLHNTNLKRMVEEENEAEGEGEGEGGKKKTPIRERNAKNCTYRRRPRYSF